MVVPPGSGTALGYARAAGTQAAAGARGRRDECPISATPGGGSDEVYDRAAELLGRDGLAEVLALLGYYSAVAMAMKLHRVPVPS